LALSHLPIQFQFGEPMSTHQVKLEEEEEEEEEWVVMVMMMMMRAVCLQ